MKTGLILEGGAMRGMFTAGVTDVMMENGITFDGVIGVSAGAVFGCNYKSHQPGRAIRYNTKFCKDPRYASLRSLLTTGDLYGEKFCYHEIPDRLDPFDTEEFRRSAMEFYVVCTDVTTGRAVYHKCEDGGPGDLQWLRASASMPLVSRVVEVDGYRLLDGGISDSVPLRQFEEMGYHRNVVILTQPKGYVKEKNKYLPLMRVVLRKYPKLIAALACRHEVYNENTQYIHQQAQQGEVFLIQPEAPLEVGPVEHDAEKLKAVYELGRRSGIENLESVRAFLAGKSISE